MDNNIKIFATPYELAETFAGELVSKINASAINKRPFTLALSGGTTPELLFSILGDHFSKSAEWEFVHLFWGDERCVPADNSESNYGMTKRSLIDKIIIPSVNIHRIRGEADPEEEADRYSREVSSFTLKRDGLPVFDLVILGLGDDGHTASIFPGHPDLFSSDKLCKVAIHPLTYQRRVTITGKVINNAEEAVFLVTGKKKAAIVESIINKTSTSEKFPASFIVPVYGSLTWYFDKEAAYLLDQDVYSKNEIPDK